MSERWSSEFGTTVENLYASIRLRHSARRRDRGSGFTKGYCSDKAAGFHFDTLRYSAQAIRSGTKSVILSYPSINSGHRSTDAGGGDRRWRSGRWLSKAGCFSPLVSKPRERVGQGILLSQTRWVSIHSGTKSTCLRYSTGADILGRLISIRRGKQPCCASISAINSERWSSRTWNSVEGSYRDP